MYKHIYPLIFISLFLIGKQVSAGERPILLNDVNTYNIEDKLNDIPISNIKQICSYDYCDYIDTNNLKSSLSDFVNKYIDSINDPEVKNSIMVKGIKITKVIFKP